MTTVSLSGSWTLHDAEGAAVAPCPIPGDVHSALAAASRIPDPLVGMNEAELQWVGEAEWEIRRSFELTEAELDGRWAVLELEFVDTFAELSVNGIPLASLETSFRRHRIDATAALRPGTNAIALRFRPAGREAAARAARLPFPIPWSVSNNRVADMNAIRKAQCHAGWDWGPCLMVLGVYAEPRLLLLEEARIEAFVIRQDHRDDGSVAVTAEVDLVARRDGVVPVTVTIAGESATAEVAVAAGRLARAVLPLTVEKPELWWPAGLGGQRLYEAVAEIPDDRAVRRIGFRRLELVNAPDAAGISMTFRVNGRDIFARGANWIPADSLPARITPERIRRLLTAARDANMNMVRVWGGGFYEFDAFYEACDELGLLVWQDMMFSCSQYPSTPDFLAEVDREIRYQVRRLASHPSVALWCGDNEVIGSLNWYDLSKKNRDRYLVNYDRLNHAIETAVTESDPDRRFWPSSPCGGALDYGDSWHDDSKGDMHFWSVWHEGRDFEHYHDVRPRFCSEFGFQSFPTMTVIRRFAEPEEWNATSPVMEFHQRDRSGNGKIVETMTRYFRVPTSFPSFVYLSQLQQALAIETAVRWWRSLKPHCMGALYWQLNDVWPSVSWSSIDHALAWKTLHHHARRFFAPLALSARIADGVLAVTAVNDGPAAAALELRLRRLGLDGGLRDETHGAAELPADRAVPVLSTPAAAGRDFFWVLDGRAAGAADWDPALQLVVFPDKPKRLPFPASRIAVSPGDAAGRFHLSADAPAFFVRPEAAAFDGRFDDASFLLLPGEPRSVAFHAADARIPGVGDVVVQHLAETYR